MNSLSWMIYAIQLIDSLGTFLGWLAGFLFSTSIVLFITRILTSDDKSPDAPQYHAKMMRYVKWALPCGFLVAFINVVIPDRNTMLLIAASQIGERVINSETTREIAGEVRSVVTPSTELLRTWIEDQTRQIRGVDNNPPPRAGR